MYTNHCVPQVFEFEEIIYHALGEPPGMSEGP